MYGAGSRQLPLWEGSYRGLQRKMRRKVPSRANKKDLKCFHLKPSLVRVTRFELMAP